MGLENAVVDQGLYLGRSFRVGWGPGGTLVHLGDLCGPSSKPCVAYPSFSRSIPIPGLRKSTANASIVKITTVPMVAAATADATAQAARLLTHHLSHTTIEDDADGVQTRRGRGRR